MRMLVSTAIIAGSLHGFEEAVAIADIDMRETPALDDDPVLHHEAFSTAAGRHIAAQGSFDDFRQRRLVFDCPALGIRQDLVGDVQRRSHTSKHIIEGRFTPFTPVEDPAVRRIPQRISWSPPGRRSLLRTFWPSWGCPASARWISCCRS